MMSRATSLLLLVLFALPVWGAATWYVRPDTQGEYGLEDGTSLADAFDGNADIAWASISNGDTVVYCGDWLPADARLTFTTKTAAAGAPVTVTGDATLCGRTTNSTVDRTGTTGASSRAMAGSAVAHYIIEDFTLKNCGQYCLSWDTSGGDPTLASNVEIREIDFENCGNGIDTPGACIWGRGTDWSVHDNAFDGCGDDCIWHDGAQSIAYSNTFTRVSFLSSGGDCIQFTGHTNGNSMWENDCDHSHYDYKQCYIFGTASDSPILHARENKCRLPIGATVSNGFYVDATGGAAYIERNWVVGGLRGMTFVGGDNYIRSNISARATEVGVNIGTGVTSAAIEHNSIAGTATGIVSSKAGTTITMRNNAISTTSVACIEKGGPTNVEDYNNLHDCGANTVARGGAPETPGASDILADPQFIGGPNPTTPEGFQPKPNSPLIGAGSPLGAKYDKNGYRFGNPSNLGAYGSTYQDTRSSYTNRTDY